MPQLLADLSELVAIPSVSTPGVVDAPLLDAFDLTSRLFAGAGVEVGRLDLPGTAPVLTGSIPAPPGAPTVLFYSHYDVVAAGDPSSWASPPFVATERDGAVYGRGTADTKSNILAFLGALRAWGTAPPVGIKLLIEGHEEVGSGALLDAPALAEHVAADALLIGDMGNTEPGVPTLTTAIRGGAEVRLEVRTLASPQHSGKLGGAAPDALLVLLHAIASLHDASGSVAVPGLRREESDGPGEREDDVRDLAAVLSGVPLMGQGSIGGRLVTGPAITVTGLDAPRVDDALNAVPHQARAVLDVRGHPGQDATEVQRAVIEHLEAQRPFGVTLDVRPGWVGDGVATRTDGPAYAAARAAWSQAWAADVVLARSGGSIPVVGALARLVPEAEILIVGTADGAARIHGSDERVLLSELERTVAAEADFLGSYANAFNEVRRGAGRP